jgi:hypothetical protein
MFFLPFAFGDRICLKLRLLQDMPASTRNTSSKLSVGSKVSGATDQE